MGENLDPSEGKKEENLQDFKPRSSPLKVGVFCFFTAKKAEITEILKFLSLSPRRSQRLKFLMAKKIIFITGAVKSGKSQFALEMGKKFPAPRAFLATAQAFDREMAERIRRHKESRSLEWETIEEPVQIIGLVKEIGEKVGLILIDCLTLWISNLLMAGWTAEKILTETDNLLQLCRQTNSSFILVSNEVGWGIVPENEVARFFRDVTGIVHQKIAQEADEVYLMVCGLPQRLKGPDRY